MFPTETEHQRKVLVVVRGLVDFFFQFSRYQLGTKWRHEYARSLRALVMGSVLVMVSILVMVAASVVFPVLIRFQF